MKYLRDRNIEPTLKFLGHGIGQTIHEEPYITDTRTVVMEPNITFTMEPLYMIPGRMGFHVEDMYLITPAGFEPITGMITPNDELIRDWLMCAFVIPGPSEARSPESIFAAPANGFRVPAFGRPRNDEERTVPRGTR